MANQQPTARPWFRLASQIRLEQPPPPPSTPAAAPPARPMFGRLQSFLPLSLPPASAPPPPPPAPKQEPPQGWPATPTVKQPPAVPVPEKLRSTTQQLPPVTAGSSPAPAAFRNTVTPPESPKVIKPMAQTPPESPKRMPKEPPLTSPSPRRFLASTPPPTPPRLQQPNPEPEPALKKQNLPPPPAQAPSSLPTFPPYPKKIEDHYPKSLGEDKIAVTESANVKSNSSKKKKQSASESSASALGMLTIAGENTGAYMELGCGRHSSKNPAPFTGRFYQLSKKDDHLLQSDNGATTEEAKKKKNAPVNAAPMAALVNSNVQGANNSLLFNSTCVHGSPGVHIFLSSSNNRRHSGAPPPKIDGYR